MISGAGLACGRSVAMVVLTLTVTVLHTSVRSTLSVATHHVGQSGSVRTAISVSWRRASCSALDMASDITVGTSTVTHGACSRTVLVLHAQRVRRADSTERSLPPRRNVAVSQGLAMFFSGHLLWVADT